MVEAKRRRHIVRFALVLVGLVTVPAAVPAQSSEFLDRILAEDELRLGSALYLAITASYALQDQGYDLDVIPSLRRVQRRVGLDSEAPITLGQYAFILQVFFDLPSGVFSRLIPGPRYATRDLAHADIIRGRAYPAMPLSGRRGLRIIGRALAYIEGDL